VVSFLQGTRRFMPNPYQGNRRVRARALETASEGGHDDADHRCGTGSTCAPSAALASEFGWWSDRSPLALVMRLGGVFTGSVNTIAAGLFQGVFDR
jgi:hypothetical protein